MSPGQLISQRVFALSDVYRAPRAVSWGVVAAVCSVLVVMLLFVSYVLFRTAIPMEVARVTNGAIRGPQLAYFIEIGLLCLVMIKLGGLRAADVGLRRADLVPAAAATFAIWLAAQMLLASSALAAGHGLSIDPAWIERGAANPGIAFAGQLFATALAEELAFRGFLTPQLATKLAAGGMGARTATAVAIVGVQLAFALSHVPQRLASDVSGLELVSNLGLTWVIGIGFALLYWRTGNLLLVVGIHALSNELAPLFDSPLPQAVAFNVVIAALVVAWPAATTSPGTVASPQRP